MPRYMPEPKEMGRSRTECASDAHLSAETGPGRDCADSFLEAICLAHSPLIVNFTKAPRLGKNMWVVLDESS